jgi:hypothetical protein
MIFSLFLNIIKNMAFIWQIGLYGKKYGKIQKIWHLPYLQGSPATLDICENMLKMSKFLLVFSLICSRILPKF